MPANYAASVADLLFFDRLREGLQEMEQDSFDRALEHKVAEQAEERSIALADDLIEDRTEKAYGDGFNDAKLEAEAGMTEKIAAAEESAYQRGFAEAKEAILLAAANAKNELKKAG
jgi:hypothetical protein